MSDLNKHNSSGDLLLDAMDTAFSVVNAVVGQLSDSAMDMACDITKDGACEIAGLAWDLAGDHIVSATGDVALGAIGAIAS